MQPFCLLPGPSLFNGDPESHGHALHILHAAYPFSKLLKEIYVCFIWDNIMNLVFGVDNE